MKRPAKDPNTIMLAMILASTKRIADLLVEKKIITPDEASSIFTKTADAIQDQGDGGALEDIGKRIAAILEMQAFDRQNRK